MLRSKLLSHWYGPKRRSIGIFGALLGVAACFGASSASATGLDLGIAKNYSLVALGSSMQIGQNSGPLVGDELLGNGINAAFAGGGNGSISGTLFYDNTVTGTGTFGNLQTPPTTQLVSTSITFSGPGSALSSANMVASYAAGLSPTQTFGTINSATTITGNGGLNVINVGSISNANLTLSGNANDIFVINVSGNYQTNKSMTLTGVLASRVLFNFTGTSGNVFQTSGGDCAGGKTCLYGTFLAANGGNFQFSNLNIVGGALINTAGDVQFVSGTQITGYVGFVPEPSTALLLSAGLMGLAAMGSRRRRA